MRAEAIRQIWVSSSRIPLAAFAIACSGAPAEKSSESSAPVPEAESVEGTFPDEATNSAARNPSEAFVASANGIVTTSFGELMKDVRSNAPIAHMFQEALPGTPERLFVQHYVKAASGHIASFEFDYTEGVRTFPITQSGYFSITTDGRVLMGRSGTVTIEPSNDGAIRISFDQLAVAQEGASDPSDLEVIGSGVVEGPMRRACLRARDVVLPEGDPNPLAVPVHDATWIGQFCGP